MGKATKTGDNIPMGAGIFQTRVFSKTAKQFHALVLIVKILRMHEWHIEEFALKIRQVLIKPPLDRVFGYFKSPRVGDESLRGSPKHIAGKLVQDNHLGQTTFRGIGELLQIACNGLFVSLLELLGDQLIHLWRALKP